MLKSLGFNADSGFRLSPKANRLGRNDNYPKIFRYGLPTIPPRAGPRHRRWQTTASPARGSNGHKQMMNDTGERKVSERHRWPPERRAGREIKNFQSTFRRGETFTIITGFRLVGRNDGKSVAKDSPPRINTLAPSLSIKQGRSPRTVPVRD